MEILSDRMEVGSIPYNLFTSWRNYGLDLKDYELDLEDCGLDSEDYDDPQRNRLVRVLLPAMANR